MRRWRRILWRWVILGWVLALGTSPLGIAQPDRIGRDLTQKKKDLKDVKRELSLAREKEKRIEGRESSILEGLHLLETELSRKERELKGLENQLAQTKERLDQTTKQILVLNGGMERTKQQLLSRLIALYKTGRSPSEAFLLTSQSYPDLLRLDRYLRMIIDFDRRLIDTYRYQVALKERFQSELIEDQSQKERSIDEVEKKKEEIKQVREERRDLLKSIQNQKVVHQKLILELEERARELQTLIDKLEREKTHFAHAKPKSEPLKGRLTPPVPGKIISLFKEKGQNGIEIKSPLGTEIRAILPGKVLYADWFKGFGNVVIIDHGDHLFTVSAYCSKLLKKNGDVVSQGEVIALVGSAGSLKGPCLYFEIRHHGKPQDPVSWIAVG